jgi:hypothetical protein
MSLTTNIFIKMSTFSEERLKFMIFYFLGKYKQECGRYSFMLMCMNLKRQAFT